MFTAAVITISDRSFRGERVDQSGPKIAEILRSNGYEVKYSETVPDDAGKIARSLKYAADSLNIALIITTGGTGFAPRDITPEVTISVCEKLIPGIPEVMRSACLEITPRAMLSRAVAGIRGRSIIINLPGSPKAAEENLLAVIIAVEHGLKMLSGKPADCAES